MKFSGLIVSSAAALLVTIIIWTLLFSMFFSPMRGDIYWAGIVGATAGVLISSVVMAYVGMRVGKT